MSGAEPGAGSLKPGGRREANPAGQAMLKEVLSLRSKSIKIIARQVNDLKSVASDCEERELLEHIDLCISIASRLSRCVNQCMADPSAANDPDLRRFVIDASLLLSQHEDDAPGK